MALKKEPFCNILKLLVWHSSEYKTSKYFDPQLDIYFLLEFFSPYSDVSHSEECQTKKVEFL